MRPTAQPPLTQWFRENSLWNETWVRRGLCAMHQHLPWIDDHRPTTDETAQMAAVCSDCPVLAMCASYALLFDRGRGVDGGFYAGVWIPWKTHGESENTRSMRISARAQLKKLLGIRRRSPMLKPVP